MTRAKAHATFFRPPRHPYPAPFLNNTVFWAQRKMQSRCENAFEPRNAPLAEASKGEPLAEANGCCPAGGHRTGARWFPMVARGSRRADAVDHCDLLPAEHHDCQQDDSGGPTSPTPVGPYRPPPPPPAAPRPPGQALCCFFSTTRQFPHRPQLLPPVLRPFGLFSADFRRSQ